LHSPVEDGRDHSISQDQPRRSRRCGPTAELTRSTKSTSIFASSWRILVLALKQCSHYGETLVVLFYENFTTGTSESSLLMILNAFCLDDSREIKMIRFPLNDPACEFKREDYAPLLFYRWSRCYQYVV
jgi:hypothetical protein